MKLVAISAVILSPYEYSKSEIVTSYLLLVFLDSCGYAFTNHSYRKEGYGGMSRFFFMSVPILRAVSQC